MFDLRSVNRQQFDDARTFWTGAIVVKLGMFAVGTYAAFASTPIPYLPEVLLAFAVASELLQLRSDVLKSRAEGVLRLLDAQDAFGTGISQAARRDIILSAPKRSRPEIEATSNAAYFDSKEPNGPRKALEQLGESAWYSRHLTFTMVAGYAAGIVGLFVMSVAALIVSSREVTAAETRDAISHVVTSWLMLIVSLSMLRSLWTYVRFHARCQRTETDCEHLLAGEVSVTDSQRQWQEYQLARASSGLLPNWLWRLRKDALDRAWRVATRE